MRAAGAGLGFEADRLQFVGDAGVLRICSLRGELQDQRHQQRFLRFDALAARCFSTFSEQDAFVRHVLARRSIKPSRPAAMMKPLVDLAAMGA